MSELQKRLAKLLSVKSIMTLILTVVFAILALRGEIGQDFMTVYTMIVSFFFGYATMKESKDSRPTQEKGGEAE